MASNLKKPKGNGKSHKQKGLFQSDQAPALSVVPVSDNDSDPSVPMQMLADLFGFPVTVSRDNSPVGTKSTRRFSPLPGMEIDLVQEVVGHLRSDTTAMAVHVRGLAVTPDMSGLHVFGAVFQKTMAMTTFVLDNNDKKFSSRVYASDRLKEAIGYIRKDLKAQFIWSQGKWSPISLP